MSEDASFADLIRRVRAGDQGALTELYQRYEHAIRRVVRVRLTDPAMRRLFDSMDIYQSIMVQFFNQATAGAYELDTPEQLIKLLTTMARHKVINHVHQQQAARRDYRRNEPLAGAGQKFSDPGENPIQEIEDRDWIAKIRRHLSAEEWHLFEQRAAGCSWDELAAELGEEPDTLRMRLNRARERVRGEVPAD